MHNYTGCLVMVNRNELIIITTKAVYTARCITLALKYVEFSYVVYSASCHYSNKEFRIN